jgi:Aldehyde dehydrogenase family
MYKAAKTIAVAETKRTKLDLSRICIPTTRAEENVSDAIVLRELTPETADAAEATSFGLSSGICTTSLKHASHFKRNSEAGMVMVNLSTAGVGYHVPFGGRKG